MIRSSKSQHTRKGGAFQGILKLFLEPILKKRPPNIEPGMWLKGILHTDTRIIQRYEAVAPFKMPGLYKASGNVRVQGFGYREIKPGDVLWVRTDDNVPGIIEIEAMIGQSGSEHVFELDRLQWVWVKQNVKKIEEEPIETI